MARILIADDEVDLLRLCQCTLQEAEHDVDIVTSGSAVLERARHEPPDLIVLDWVMPDMDGSVAVAKLRGCAECRNIPILAISALHDGAMRMELAGADHFLSKPFGPDDLVDAVNQVLARAT
jgi:DNA-binding response OmpR family regulator